jgi:hypothetical protein
MGALFRSVTRPATEAVTTVTGGGGPMLSTFVFLQAKKIIMEDARIIFNKSIFNPIRFIFLDLNGELTVPFYFLAELVIKVISEWYALK